MRVAAICVSVITRYFTITKAWKNSGPQLSVFYMRGTVITVDVTTGYYCIWFSSNIIGLLAKLGKGKKWDFCHFLVLFGLHPQRVMRSC